MGLTPSLRLYLTDRPTDQYHLRRRGRPCSGLGLGQGPMLKTGVVDAEGALALPSCFPLSPVPILTPRYWQMRTVTCTCRIGRVWTDVHALVHAESSLTQIDLGVSTCEHKQTHAHLGVHIHTGGSLQKLVHSSRQAWVHTVRVYAGSFIHAHM